MAKVLLVEDDNNLREIYQARLMAEGYDIVTAQNGEEALVVAKQQKPELIISDVMMPRISGFEMLDILRNTAELKHTKVIMLTALGQDDDQTRANSLGADRYLVKSQVTLEDIVTASKELLSGDSASAPAPTAPSVDPAPAPSMVAPVAPGVPAITHIPDTNPPAAQVAPAAAAALSVAAVAPASPTSAVPPAAQPAPAPAVPAGPSTATPSVQAPDPLAPAVVTPPADPPAAAAPSEPTAVAPVAAPVAVEPEPSEPPVPSGPTTPAQPPAPAVIDKAAQGLEAEEAALQAQIASYSQPAGGTAAPADHPVAATPSGGDVTPAAPAAGTAQASNDQALADAVKQLNTPDAAGPGTAPDLTTTPPAAPAPGSDSAAAPAGRKIIQPVSDPAAKPDLDALLAKENAANAASAADTPATPPPATPPNAPGATPGQTFDPSTSL